MNNELEGKCHSLIQVLFDICQAELRKTKKSRNCAATYNVNCHYFMALSHTFYVIKVFLSKKIKNILNPLYFSLPHTFVSSDRQLRNAGLRSSLSLFIHQLSTLKRRAAKQISREI
jgi:hypothetical protein